MTYFEYILAVALCAASISYTICCTSIFKGIREWLSKFHHKLEELIHCPYCFSHYVIIVIMLTTEGINGYLVHISQSIVYNFLFKKGIQESIFIFICFYISGLYDSCLDVEYK